MATYEDIKKANETIKTTPIKGKDYAEVPQRINAFRQVYPEGFIVTEMKSNDNGVCVFRAEVGYREGGFRNVLGTGTAYEKESSSFINKTSYIENCETSAVGRALGMAGFGIDTSVASAEEVKNAINNQTKADENIEEDRPINKTEVKTLTQLSESYKVNTADICKRYKVSKLEDLSYHQYGAALRVFKSMEKKA